MYGGRLRSLLDSNDRELMLNRFRSLTPDSAARWGRMGAPQMLAHLSDQMRHTLGDAAAAPRNGPLRLPVVKQLVMYWLPWPKGRIKGPPEAFVSQPTTWGEDFASFLALVERFVELSERVAWPDHAIFGRMSRRSWGWFCHRHFDHHLRQFGA
jgi:hypothetical protein